MNQGADVTHVETFRPRLAPVMAVLWYCIAAFGGYDLVRRGDGREIAVGLACLALVTVIVYAIAQRPAIVAGPRGVLLRNVVRDVWMPWHAVKAIETKWSLSFATADASYSSWALTGGGAGRPRRQRTFGAAPLIAPSPPPEHEISWTVPDRLEQLRRRGLHGERTGTVELRPAWSVIAAFGLSVVVLVVVLVVPAG